MPSLLIAHRPDEIMAFDFIECKQTAMTETSSKRFLIYLLPLFSGSLNMLHNPYMTPHLAD